MENRTIEEIIDGFCTLMLQKNYRTKTVFEYRKPSQPCTTSSAVKHSPNEAKLKLYCLFRS